MFHLTFVLVMNSYCAGGLHFGRGVKAGLIGLALKERFDSQRNDGLKFKHR